MTSDYSKKRPAFVDSADQLEIRDLSDFYHQWHELRPAIIDMLKEDRPLDIQERAIVAWLAILADKISTADLS